MNKRPCKCGGMNEECIYCGGSGEITETGIEIIKIDVPKDIVQKQNQALDNYLHKESEKLYGRNCRDPFRWAKKKKKRPDINTNDEALRILNGIRKKPKKSRKNHSKEVNVRNLSPKGADARTKSHAFAFFWRHQLKKEISDNEYDKCVTFYLQIPYKLRERFKKFVLQRSIKKSDLIFDTFLDALRMISVK